MLHLPTGIEAKSQHQNRRTARLVLEQRVLSFYNRKQQLEFDKLRKDKQGSGMRGDKIRTYLVPSNKYVNSKGISKEDGISMEMHPNRHVQTRTYGNNDASLLNETPRQALGRDIKNAKKVYEQNGVYNSQVRQSLQEVIKENKNAYPNLYNK